ncbi:MAG: branched-chain-amino-acid transaminase [Planctomycetota bacterium]|nr:branched-chain-amino-acid transaminase [Planctomycetota bacterium]
MSQQAPFASTTQQQAPDPDKPLIWLDGKIVPRSQAVVNVYDHGLLYGDGVFEGIRVYNGRIFKAASHINRLFRSAERIRLTIPYSREEFDALMRETLKANNLRDAYIRLVVTRGVGTLGLHPFRCPKPGVFCIADKIQLYPVEMYRDGMPIIVAKRPRIPIECLDPRIKSLNYLNNILAKIEAIDAGVLEALMLNVDGEVAECTGDNIFIINDGRVFTPPSEAGILEGVTRAFVFDLCRELRISIEEKSLYLKDVLSADEVFLTGTAAEVIAVSRIDDTSIGNGAEGPVTKRIREAFKAAVANDAPED